MYLTMRAVMPLNHRFEDLRAPTFEPRQRAGLVSLHQAAVPDHIGGKDGGETPLGPFFGHGPDRPQRTLSCAVFD